MGRLLDQPAASGGGLGITPASTGAFIRTLRHELNGEVCDDAASRAVYAWDASNHRVVPLAVIFPKGTDDVVRIIRRCAEAGIPFTSRGGGTNIAGNAIGSGVVVDFSRHMRAVRQVDQAARTALVEPGVVLDDLNRSVAAHGLTFAVDPSSHSRCTLGGMIGTNACGSHSVAWGTTADNVDAVDVVLVDGSHIRLDAAAPASISVIRDMAGIRDAYLGDIRRELGRFSRQISGYALQHLLPERGFDPARAFVGTEGTCAIVVAARVRLTPPPAVRVLVVAGFADELAAAAAAPALAWSGALTVEAMDHRVVQAFDSRPNPGWRPILPRGTVWLLLEAGGDNHEDARSKAAALATIADDHGAWQVHTFTERRDMATCWLIREKGVGLTTRPAGGREAWPGWEDAAVPAERLSDYLRDFRLLLDRYGRDGVLYGHFGEGCVHIRIDHDLLTAEGRAAYRSFQQDAADLVVAHDGSLSGEHGDGRARSELLSRMYSNRILDAFAAFKHAFDPQGLLNPGVIVDPRPLDADFRLALTRPPGAPAGFAFRTDDGEFGKAVRRCVGVGACRKASGGGMCPSFRATQDERHSTRGRARALAEMLEGHLAADGWRSKDVLSVLDLCLGCKACRSECPVSVDMATYKAEFLYRHYRGRLRPMAHLSMGALPLWLAVVRRMPHLFNGVLAMPVLAAAAKWLGGIDSRRRLPRVATQSVRRWFRRRPRGTSAEPVMLWTDTFTSSFAPEIVRDAVAVLEVAGYRVELSPVGLCCGLTWISTGQLGVARRVMRRTVRLLDQAQPQLPIVVLEPSCAATLRDDLPELIDEPAAHRVAGRVRTLAEVLHDRALPDVDAAPVHAIAQFHCHQRAVIGTDLDRDLLHRVGVTVEAVDEGCCGLAGNFGFEKGHFDISLKCAEQSFMPHLRRAEAETVVVADGFSCRLQIAELGGRAAVHLASVLRERLVTDGASPHQPRLQDGR